MTSEPMPPRLPFDEEPASVADAPEPESDLVDASARRYATDPAVNVVLEASAGTGKTRVLVDRFVNLLRAGVDPDHMLAVTFTRKAAAEMRARIIDRLRGSSRSSAADLVRWRDLKDRLGDIDISTIDAFCLSLLREFPLEADVDPAFDLADETQVPRLVRESLDQTFRFCRSVAKRDEDVALVFAQLGERRLRAGIGVLLGRRLVAPRALRQYLARGPRDLTVASACRQAADRLRACLSGAASGLEGFLETGPVAHPHFAMLAADLSVLGRGPDALKLETPEGQALFRVLVDRLRAYFVTQDGRPRDGAFAGTGYKAAHCRSDDAWRQHRREAAALAPGVADLIRGFRRDLNVIQARGVWRIYAVAVRQYEQQLESRALLDFSGVLERAVTLLKGMDEFARSRFRLEARFRHVLVDEFQDTSRAQWELVAQLVRNWGEGLGAAADALPPSIFVVGDRKQSIYGFRDAEVGVLDEAAAFVGSLRTDGDPRRAISVSFRSRPAVLAFVNDVFSAVVGQAPRTRADAFTFRESDRFPLTTGSGSARLPDRATVADAALGLIVDETVRQTADRVGDEIVRLLGRHVVGARTGVPRVARPADIAILFRSRDSHREFERALEERHVPTYVYKGLGFFEADEVQDVMALIKFLADPVSDARAAALLRSRLIRLSDVGLASLAPRLSAAVCATAPPDAVDRLGTQDRRVLLQLRRAVPVWLARVDRVAPAELVDGILDEVAYAFEIRGPARRQAYENLKKIGAMIRRFQNTGYATLARLAVYLEDQAVGDESNATVDALDAVSLMTVHAAKGLEFPVVFLVNLGRGTGGVRPPIRLSAAAGSQPEVAIADFQSDADEDAQAREREETKRLLYVAMTRARDRLYLSAALRGGAFRPGRGSLGEVLPPGLRGLFTEAAAGDVDRLIQWAGPDGVVHDFAVPANEPARGGIEVREAASAHIDDFAGACD